MDRIHSELDELLLRTDKAQPQEWLELLEAIDAHLRIHFEAENGWMRETDFPPRDCHMAEHAAVLHSSSEVMALARTGDVSPAPHFVDELRRWFPAHADYLDSALAAWMSTRQHGGKPVVVRRDLARITRPASD